jgi:predicted negative regulator of RcsB-dependent stress response
VLANVVPDLHTEPGAPEAIGESQERTRLFEAMRRALTALGKTRPFLVVLEDLHWAGGESIDALEYIARHFAGICGVILATYRDDEQPQCSHLERVRRTLERDRRAIHVQPSRLTQDGVAQLVEQMFSDDAGAPALAQSLHRVSDGNPLFVMQLLRDFNETGQLPDATQPSADMAEILASRIARLSENSRILAEHAAVAGRTFSIDVLRDATGWSEDQVLAALSELIDRHFMRASSESARYQYTFSHNLVQLAIYAQMPPRNRERIHHRMAVICERAEAENAALAGETAQHWDAAGESQRAAAAYVRAADRAFAVYANETARAHARRAIELGASGELRYRALRQLVAADERIGDKEAWAKDVDALLHAAEQAGPDERFEALACAARRFGSIGDRHAQREMLDRMKSVATASGKPEQLARTLIDEGALLWRRGDVQNAQRGIREALAAARSAGDAKLELQARLALVHAMMYGGEVDEARAEIAAIESELGTECSAHDRMDLTRAKANAAIVREDGPSLEQYARELGELARRVGSLEAEAESERFLAYVAVYRYNLEQTRERMLSAAEKFDRAGSHQLYCSVLVDVAATNVELGNYDEAEQQLGEVLPLTQQLEWPGGTAIATLNRAEIRRLRNQLSEACELAAQGLKHALNMQDPRIQSTALCLLGSIECEMGRHDRGLAHLREGIALRRTTKADWSLAGDLCLLIDSLLIAGDVAAAREAADELQRIYDAEPKRQMSPAKICWTLALVRRACGDQAGFRSLVERGRSILEERRSAFKDPRIRDAFLSRRFCRELLAEGGTA